MSRLARWTAPWFLRRAGAGRYLAYLQEAKATQWLAPQALESLRLERLRRLLAHAAHRVPYWRACLAERGLDPANIRPEEFASLPLLTKAVLQRRADELLTEGVDPATLTVKRSSGSTGIRSQIFVDADRGDRGWAWNTRHNEWAGLYRGVRVASLWGKPSVQPLPPVTGAAARLHRWVIEELSGRVREVHQTPYGSTVPELEAFIDRAAALRPEILIGYSESLGILAELVLARPRLPFRPRSIITGGERLRPEVRDLIQRAFNRPIFDKYGSREVDIIAMPCERGRMHLNDDHLLVELLPTDDPELREVVVTDLFNYAMPMIRLQLGDLVAPGNGEPCPCGRGLRTIDRVEGRVGDICWTADGRMVSTGAVQKLVGRAEGYLKYTARQLGYHHLRFTVVPRPGAEPGAEDRLTAAARALFGPETVVEIDVVDEIAPGPHGKFRFITSEVRRPNLAAGVSAT